MRHNSDRLEALRKVMLLDTAPERAFDDITALLARGLEVPIALVNLLDDRRDWFKSCVGLPLAESPAETSFCEAFFEANGDIIVIPDTLSDENFVSHPLVVGPPFIRFYAAARLTSAGQTIGTLCAYDFVPRHVRAEQVDALRTLAAAAIELVGERRQLAAP